MNAKSATEEADRHAACRGSRWAGPVALARFGLALCLRRQRERTVEVALRKSLAFPRIPRGQSLSATGMAYLCTSFMQSELLAISLDKGKPRVAWRYGRQVPQVPSPLLVGTEVYLVSDKGIATCLDALTGEVNWTERIPATIRHRHCSQEEHLLLEP